MEIKIGEPAIVLAPMEGIVDAPVRAVLTGIGGFNYCVSEFLRISQQVPPARTFLEHVPELKTNGITPYGIPVQVQLLGGDPERLALAAKIACELGAKAIDLNFGCPAPTVNKHDGGATLLKFPKRIYDIVKTVRDGMPKTCHLSAKFRLGWDDPDAIDGNAEMAVKGGVSWITIHGRTRMNGYLPPAYWKPIGRIKKNFGIPVIANGEIWTLEDFRKCQDDTQCEHFMIGRGALANPRLALELAQELKIDSVKRALAFEPLEWSKLFSYFKNEAERYLYSRRGYLPCRTKQWANTIHRKSPVAWFDQIKTLTDFNEMMSVIEVGASKSASVVSSARGASAKEAHFFAQ